MIFTTAAASASSGADPGDRRTKRTLLQLPAINAVDGRVQLSMEGHDANNAALR